MRAVVFCSKFMNWCGQTDTYLAAAKDGESWLETNLCPDIDGPAYFCVSLPATVKQQQKGQGAATAPAVQHITLSEMERLPGDSFTEFWESGWECDIV